MLVSVSIILTLESRAAEDKGKNEEEKEGKEGEEGREQEETITYAL